MAALANTTSKEDLIEEAIALIGPPQGVRLRRFYFDRDWSGDPCVRVLFSVSKRYELTRTRVHELAEFTRKVSSSLWGLGIEEIPYIKLEEVK